MTICLVTMQRYNDIEQEDLSLVFKIATVECSCDHVITIWVLVN